MQSRSDLLDMEVPIRNTMNDMELARQLQAEYDREAAPQLSEDQPDQDQRLFGTGSRHKYEASSTRSQSVLLSLSPVDPSLELSDPNPDIRYLFLEFNEKFFRGRLSGIEVKWSPRMTLCAGLCVYEGYGGLCSVRLSKPLLKLRPRKDLVETLLHEMIHAYLFITDNNKDHDGHGPEFQKHMHRINKATGAKISIYHTFHDEVASYQQHWWHCDGPCRERRPYFGYVKRAMNRAPSARDPWWAQHQATCGGTYTKVKEPEGYGQKKAGKKTNDKDRAPGQDIRAFVGKGQTIGSAQSGKSAAPGTSRNPASIFIKASSGQPTKGDSKSSDQGAIVNGVLQWGGKKPKTSSLFSTNSSTNGSVNSESRASGKQESDSRFSSKQPSSDYGTSCGDLPPPASVGSVQGVAGDTGSDGVWSGDMDDSWVFDLDLNEAVSFKDNLPQSSNARGSSTSPNYSAAGEQDTVDLTTEDDERVDVKSRKKIADLFLKKHKKKNNGVINNRRSSSGKGSVKKTGGRMFGPDFVSVCAEKVPDKLRGKMKVNTVNKKKVKKRFVFDDLDTDDCLWDEKSCQSETSRSTLSDSSKESLQNSDSDRGTENGLSPSLRSNKETHLVEKGKDFITEKETPESVLSGKEGEPGGVHRNWKYVSEVEKEGTATSSFSSSSTSSHSNSTSGTAGTSNPNSFSGHGHKLGSTYGESLSYLAQIRQKLFSKGTDDRNGVKMNCSSSSKSYHSSTNVCSGSSEGASQSESGNFKTDLRQTGVQGKHGSASGLKRSSSEAFGSSDSSSSKRRSSLIGDHSQLPPTQRDEDVGPSRPTGGTESGSVSKVKVSCPVCGISMLEEKINNHLDLCLSAS